MKIVIIGPVYPFRGGIAHHTTLLAKALRQATHDVNIISFKQQYPSWLYPGSSDRDPSSQPLSIDATYTLEPLAPWTWTVSYTHLRAHETRHDLVCRLL